MRKLIVLIVAAVVMTVACEEAVKPPAAADTTIDGLWRVRQYVVGGNFSVTDRGTAIDHAAFRTVMIEIDDSERGYYEERFDPAVDGVRGRRFDLHHRAGHRLLILRAVDVAAGADGTYLGADLALGTEIKMDQVYAEDGTLRFRLLSSLEIAPYTQASISTEVRAVGIR